MTTAANYEYRSELLRNLSAEHQARGEARGEAKAILTVLDRRGVAVPDDVRDQVLECSDAKQLDTWLGRAITAATAADVIRD